jgi:hypothetical protein
VLLASKIPDAIVAHMVLAKIGVAGCRGARICDLIVFHVNFVNIGEAELKDIL